MNRLFLLLLLSFSLLLNQAIAADGPLQSELTAKKIVIQEDGQELLEPADQAAPGDILEYQLMYKNVGKSPISGILIEGPIPPGTTYLPASAKTLANAKLEATLDGGKSWAVPPLFRHVTNQDGSTSQMEVPETEYTSIRWTLSSPLAPDQSYSFVYRIRVNG